MRFLHFGYYIGIQEVFHRLISLIFSGGLGGNSRFRFQRGEI
jgi:hypothetical protein